MDFSTAVRKGIDNIGNFEGRSGRAEFWWFVLAVWVVEVFVLMLINVLFGSGFLGNLLWAIVWVVGFFAYLSVGIRRLHDVDQSGWMVLLGLIPCVGPLILIIFWVKQGNPSANTFGPPPANF
jgi:uncharacterized membrane protein YhaH (DUF805 family)